MDFFFLIYNTPGIYQKYYIYINKSVPYIEEAERLARIERETREQLEGLEFNVETYVTLLITHSRHKVHRYYDGGEWINRSPHNPSKFDKFWRYIESLNFHYTDPKMGKLTREKYINMPFLNEFSLGWGKIKKGLFDSFFILLKDRTLVMDIGSNPLGLHPPVIAKLRELIQSINKLQRGYYGYPKFLTFYHDRYQSWCPADEYITP